MAKDVAYFIASGRSLAGIEKYWYDINWAKQEQAAFLNEFGSTKGTLEKVEDGSHLTGLEFNTIPDTSLWRRYVKARDPKVFCPNRTTPEGKELSKRLNALPSIPNEWQLINYVMPVSDRHNNRVWDLSNRAVHARCEIEKVGDDCWVIQVNHNNGEPAVVAPMDAKAIKNSKIQEMKERVINECIAGS